MSNFVHLHTHSEYSPLDGLSTVSEIAQQVVTNGQKAFALTDHGTCSGHPELQKVADQFGVKPIFGIEAYFVHDRNERPNPAPALSSFSSKEEFDLAKEKHKIASTKIKSGYHHLILLAQNEVGLRNIWAMSTEANQSFYYKPRMDWDTLERYSEGVIASTSCLSGPISNPLLEGDETLARSNLARLLQIFDDRLYLEIHTNQLEKQFEVNKALVSLGKEFSIPLLAVVDSHFSTADHQEAHNVWIACQTQKEINDGSELFNEDLDLYIQSEDEVRNNIAYLGESAVDESIKSSGFIADQCTARMFSKKTTPTFSKVGGAQKDAERMIDMCLDVWEQNTMGKRESQAVYLARFEKETKLLIDKKFCGYFLMVADYCQWAKQQGILVGPGRGSGGGSLVAYLMGITAIDPIEADLLFERFLTEGRTSLPDFDVDFPASKKAELHSYIRDRYGDDYVVTVGTHLRLKSKGVVRDIARAMKSSLPENYFLDIEAFSKFVEEAERGTAGLGLPWDELWSIHGDELATYRDKYPKLFEMADILVGRIKTYGKHAAGVVISTDQPLTGMFPLRKGDDEENSQMVAEWDMEALEDQGLIKFDLLTLRNLDTLQETVDLIKDNYGETVDFYKWGSKEFNDTDVWEMISAGQTKGLFQVETQLGTTYAKKMRPQNLAELADLITLVRPGPMNSGLTDLYLKRRSGEIAIEFPDPRLEKVLAKTYGSLLYQEDIMQTCMILGGYDSNEADEVRKILGKKKVEQAEAAGKEFVSRAVANGMSQGDADALWGQMAEFAKYSFNRAHAYGYAILAYWCAWLKYHYPVEFMAGVLSTIDKTRIPEFVKEAQKLGIEVLPPDINQSKSGFRAVNETVRYGIDSVKGIGNSAVEKIVHGQPYASLEDFQERSGANSGVFLLLAKCGAFDLLVSNRRALVKMIEDKKDGLDKRCNFKVEGLNKHNLPCSFDWDSEPVAINPRNGKTLKPKAPPKRCSIACRNYSAPNAGLDLSIEDYSDKEIMDIESTILGSYLSRTPFDAFDPEHRETLKQSAEQSTIATSGCFVVGGVLVRVTKKKTRRGDSMAFCTIETESENLDFAVFPKHWNQYNRVLQEGNLMLAEIEKTDRGATMKSMTPLAVRN